jgi:NAD(P)H-hydrate epimerase
MQIVNSSEMKNFEKKAIEAGIPEYVLMENAGQAVADIICGMIGPCQITILVGPGNNGGDGLVIARLLNEKKYNIKVIFICGRKEEDLNTSLIRQTKIEQFNFWENEDRAKEVLLTSDIVIDSILGTGQSRPIEGTIAEILDLVSDVRKTKNLQVIAIDLPTGINDNGIVDKHTVAADITVTMGLPKYGLLAADNSAYIGKLIVSDIFYTNTDISDHYSSPSRDNSFKNNSSEYLTNELIKGILPERPLNAHKGTFGKLLSITGSDQYIGAAVLSGGSAIRSGCGLVTQAASKQLQTVVATVYPEITYLITDNGPECIREAVCRHQAVLIGCGLGRSQFAEDTVTIAIDAVKESGISCLIDADGLNILSTRENWWKGFKKPAVLTPHTGEMSRLTGTDTETINKNRIDTAIKAADKWGHIVVLKGAHTVIASPDGRAAVSPYSNPCLATAGSGDVLAGIIASLMAQGLESFEAACAGVCIHGETAEQLRSEYGDTGIIASDLIKQIPLAIKTMKNGEKNVISH